MEDNPRVSACSVESVIQTNNEALLCRKYPVQNTRILYLWLNRALDDCGLLPDPYVRLFHVRGKETVSPLFRRGKLK